jgi:uncharacterized integral membrane protein
MTTHPTSEIGRATENKGLVLSAGAISSGSGVAALIVFIAQNTYDVPVSFLFWTFTWPVWLLVLVSAALGAAIWLDLGVMRRRRRRRARRDARRG